MGRACISYCLMHMPLSLVAEARVMAKIMTDEDANGSDDNDELIL